MAQSTSAAMENRTATIVYASTRWSVTLRSGNVVPQIAVMRRSVASATRLESLLNGEGDAWVVRSVP